VTRSSPGRLQDSHPIYWLADQYCLQITVPISVTITPSYLYLLRVYIEPLELHFTIKSFMQFLTLQSLHQRLPLVKLSNWSNQKRVVTATLMEIACPCLCKEYRQHVVLVWLTQAPLLFGNMTLWLLSPTTQMEVISPQDCSDRNTIFSLIALYVINGARVTEKVYRTNYFLGLPWHAGRHATQPVS
jgi:hypothetical protein